MKDLLQQRYENDPAFHAMVDQCDMLISTLKLTPSELREAVMFAALRYDMRNPQPITMYRDAGAVGVTMKAPVQKPSEQIHTILQHLLMNAAAEQQCPLEQLPIQVVLAARLEAHERYLDSSDENKPIMSLQ